ncbi:ABC transporter ATP-binding protein [Aliiglaciecola litoralis]|uniref:ABC transporter ATP-binding protein n=1 Tax=Aliiglaciecola litoralis TaxID=582857 RepID=A0ABN1LMX3_9ALTE
MASITLRQLAHSYDGINYALQSLDHVWQQGGAYALLGPSGCGKSTLLNIISGLLEPSNGEVLFDDVCVNKLTPQQRNIAQVFQFPVVYDAMTVRENLAFPLENMRMDKPQIKRKVDQIAALLDLTNNLDRKAKSLSADDKQKISMGRGLVRDDVSAILFDEPLTVIDPHLKWKLRRKLKEIHERLNITMVYVTHDQLEAATFADEIAVMYQGKIVQFGTPQSLFDKPNHTFVGYFIGSPGMNFIAVNLKGEALSQQNTRFSLKASWLDTLAECGSGNIKLGIRPEHIRIVEQPTDTSYSAEVEFIEQLGDHQIVTVQFMQQRWHIRIGENQFCDPTQVHFELPQTYLRLYVDEYLIEPESLAADKTRQGGYG